MLLGDAWRVTVGSWEDTVENVDETFDYFLELYQSTTGRNIVALEQMLPIAAEHDAPEVFACIEQALEVNGWTREKELMWNRDRQVDEMARAEAKEISHELDQVVGAFFRQIQSIETAFSGRPRGETVVELREQLFPEGAAGYTKQPFEDKLSAIRFLLEQFDEEWREEVESLGMGPSVERLRELADEFEEALRLDDARDPLSWDEVREAKGAAREEMLRVVAKVLGTFASDSDAEARRELLAPIREQDERIAELHRQRRGVTDVDPETGEEKTKAEPDRNEDTDDGDISEEESDGEGVTV